MMFNKILSSKLIFVLALIQLGACAPLSETSKRQRAESVLHGVDKNGIAKLNGHIDNGFHLLPKHKKIQLHYVQDKDVDKEMSDANLVGTADHPLPSLHHRPSAYAWPPPSHSLMERFRQAAVTSDNGICSEIGRDVMMQKNGNAVDAAVAAMLCIGVTNAQSSGLGGGMVLTFYDAKTRSCKVIDARETAPARATAKAYSERVTANRTTARATGYHEIATPGELAGLWLAFKKFGSGRVPWSDLVMPAAKLALYGFPITEHMRRALVGTEKELINSPTMKQWIINPRTNQLYEFGDLVKRPKLANTLERLAAAEDPMKLFYEGEIADEIVEEMQRNGAFLSRSDLKNYEPRVYEMPLYTDDPHGKLRMCGPPPPSSYAITQSIIATMRMEPMCGGDGSADDQSQANSLQNDPKFYHRLIEAQKFAYAQRANLGDQAFVPEAKKLAKHMTSNTFLHNVHKKMLDKAMPDEHYTDDRPIKADKDHTGTSHTSILDSDGNAVSVTSSINQWFGSVVQSENLGIIWNDEMEDFSFPDVKNWFGYAISPTNFVAPGKRPMSSFSPMVIYNKHTGKVKFVIGGSGGAKIPSSVAKTVLHVLCLNQTVKEAIDAPVLHNQFTPNHVIYEHGTPRKLIKDLSENFAHIMKSYDNNNVVVQAIHVADDGFIYANGDFRRRTYMHPAGF
ncbi:hypothetical protein niasHT_034167 [Heterodera trifolii]|uniref:Uncharacterized protein n=1 Tax=Heterodera trifolii TaxID=157864 RepID=A0ABD2IIS9_9BILA